MEDPIPTLCASGNFTSFFKLLPGSTSDITAVADAVCSLNLTAVGKEFSDLIKLDEINSQVGEHNNSLDLFLSSFFLRCSPQKKIKFLHPTPHK